MSIKREIKNTINYIYLIIYSYLKRGSNKKIVFIVDGKTPGFANDLRGYSLAKELNKTGWSSIVINNKMSIDKIRKILKLFNPEYVYFQKLRGENSDIRYFKNYKCILDVDDADFLDINLEEKFKENSKLAFACFAGSEYVESWLKKYNNNTYIIWTGAKPLKNKKIRENKPVISWTCSDPFAYKTEAEFVKKIIVELKKRKEFIFYLIGVRDLEQGKKWLEEIEINSQNIKQFPFMNYQKLNKLLQRVDIGLAPLFPKENPYSSGKSFGKILAYLNNNSVVVASDCLEHQKFFNGENGFLCSDELNDWVLRLEKLIENRKELENITKKAKKDFIDKLSIKAAANKINNILK